MIQRISTYKVPDQLDLFFDLGLVTNAVEIGDAQDSLLTEFRGGRPTGRTKILKAHDVRRTPDFILPLKPAATKTDNFYAKEHQTRVTDCVDWVTDRGKKAHPA
jgi:hypothetical protein